MKNLENTLIEWEKIFNFICETGQINSLNNYSYYFLKKLNNIKQKKELKTKLIMKKISQEFELTEREKEVLNLLLAGQSNQKIAKELFISINTVKKHLSNIYQKAKVKSRTELTALVFKSKINNS